MRRRYVTSGQGVPPGFTVSLFARLCAVSAPSPATVLSSLEEHVKVLHWGAAIAAVVATMLVAGCGASGSGAASTSRPSSGASTASATPTSVATPPAAATLIKQVNLAMANARSVHITLPVQPGSGGDGLDISLTRSNDMYGVLMYKGQPLTVLVRNGQTYMKLTAGAMKAMGMSSSVCVLMCGKVLKMTASQSKSMIAGAGWSTLAPTPGSVPRLHYVRVVTVDGQSAWQMSMGGGAAVYLAAQGTHYPLRVVKGTYRIDFTQWNSVTIPSLPPASQVVDLSQLEHS